MPDAAATGDIVIAGAARTPMGGFQGELCRYRPRSLVAWPFARRLPILVPKTVPLTS